MSIVAHSHAQPAPAADTDVPVPLWRHRAAIGLALSLLLAILLGGFFHAQAQGKVAADWQQRLVLSEAAALAELVGKAESGEGSSASQELLDEWIADRPGRASARVVRLAGARLVASTDPADSTPRPLPRRLGPDEKALYDQAQELRAAADTNLEEGVFRKRQVQIGSAAGGRLEVSVPYLADGQIAGMLQFSREVPPVPAPSMLVTGLLAVLVPLALFLVAGRLLYRPVAEGDGGIERQWPLFALAVLLFSVAVWAFASTQGALLQERQESLAGSLSEHYLTLSGAVDTAAAAAGVAVPRQRDTARWDIDAFQRPLGVLGGDARIDPGVLARETAFARTAVAKRIRWIGAGALALLAFVALGYGRSVRQTLIEHRSAYLYVMPAMLGMLVLVFFPFFYGIALSFTDQTNYTINEPLGEVFVGIKNYITILGDVQVFQRTADGIVWNYSNFYYTLFITVCWTVFNVAIGVTFGMILALALNTEGLRMKTVYRVLLILPWAIPNYITALIWKGMFHPQFGVINQIIQLFGGSPVAWFDGVFSAFITGLATNGWLSFPFMMVVILGALQSISADMYEAARVEGANRWQQFRHITLPLLKPTLVPAVIISVVWTFNMFNVIYLVSEGQPAGANEILITEAYKLAFEKYQLGYSAAYSVVIFIILLVYGVFQTRMTRATEAAS